MRACKALSSFVGCLGIMSAMTAWTVSACEGECITGITHVFVGNYTNKVSGVFGDLARTIREDILPDRTTDEVRRMLAPMEHTYSDGIYEEVRKAVFPGYFHGKCQRDGQDPPGCPNPDCPVVCGTPGSMVHFYDKLTSIVFDTVESSLNDVLSSSHGDYKRLQQSVISAARSSSPSSLSPGSDNVAYFQPPSRQDTPSLPLNGGSLIPLRRKRGLDTLAMRPVLQRIGKRRSAKVDHGSNDVADRLQSAMKEARTVLRRECGGDLQQCSWERDMKDYILTFP